MRLVEIAGHLIDPGKVTHVGPIGYDKSEEVWSFNVCANGASWWEYKYETIAQDAKESLLAAIESAQPECCVSWPKHDEPVDGESPRERFTDAGVGLWPSKHPQDGGIMPLEASDALVGVEPQGDPAGRFAAGPQPLGHHHYYERQEDGSFKFRWEPNVPGTTYAGGQVVRERELKAADAPVRVEPTVFCRYWPQCPQRDESPVLGSICLVCAASGKREQYRQELEAKKVEDRWKAFGLEPEPTAKDTPADALVEIECGPEVRGTFQDGKFVTAMKVESDDQIPLSCPADCADGIPELACCRLCVITGTRAGRIAR